MLLKPRPRTLLDLGHPINRSCVAAFLLGEGQGVKCFDSSVSRNDATFTDNGGGSPYLRNPWFPARGGSGVAYRPLAPGSLVNATVGNHTPPTGDMTVCVEYFPFALADYYPVVGQWNEGSTKRSWLLVVFGSGLVYAYSSSDGAAFRESDSNATAITTGKWYTIIAGYPASGGAVTININGVEISTATSGSEAYLGLFNTAQPIYFGYSPQFAGAVRGGNAAIGNARVWNRLLSADEKRLLNTDRYVGYRDPTPDRKLYFFGAAATGAGAGATVVELGLATETDTALSITPERTYTLGLATETDSALSATLLAGDVVPLGLATETDTALSVQMLRLGLATETDTAFPILPLQTSRWPYDDLKPRHIGIYPVAAPIGGGVALTGKEPVIDSGAGYWRFAYGGVYVKNRAQVLKMRQVEALLEGRGRPLLIYVFDGKRAPWPGGVAGSTITVTANAAVAQGATSIALNATAADELLVGHGFSAGHCYYLIKAISGPVGSVYTATIWPKTREAIASGAALEFARPICRVRLAHDGDAAMMLRLLKFGDVNLEFVEDAP